MLGSNICSFHLNYWVQVAILIKPLTFWSSSHRLSAVAKDIVSGCSPRDRLAHHRVMTFCSCLKVISNRICRPIDHSVNSLLLYFCLGHIQEVSLSASGVWCRVSLIVSLPKSLKLGVMTFSPWGGRRLSSHRTGAGGWTGEREVVGQLSQGRYPS